MSQDLLEKIGEVDQEVAENLREGGLTSEDVKDLCFEALKEIIPAPGMKGILLRSRIWKVISLENSKESSSASSSPATSFEKPKVVKKRKLEYPTITDHDESTTSEDSSTSSAIPVVKKIMTSQVKSPAYTIYKDKEVDMAVQTGNIPVELRHRIIRGTIHNMVSLAFNPPWSRMPTTNEVMEMAKSLVITYPLLSDPATKHVVLFKQLKKRLYNMKPVEKKRGPKVKKPAIRPSTPIFEPEETHTSTPKLTPNAHSNSVELEELEINDEISESATPMYSEPIMERHYSALVKEMSKTRQSPEVINMYLNKEFVARRQRILNMTAEERHKKVFETYPCFKDHVEIIEEVRRVLEIVENDQRHDFMNQCVERFEEEVDNLIYFGVSKQRIVHPSKPNKVAKAIHLIKNAHVIFGGSTTKTKQGKKAVCDLVYPIKEHEDPEVVCRKNSTKVPMLMVDSKSVYLVYKGSIIFSLRLEKIQEAVMGLIGTFYLLDIDYPRSHELGLTILQNIIFDDKSVPGDILDVFTFAMAEYSKFKNN